MSQQIGWCYCKKCQGLIYAGFPSLGACAAGGNHDPNGSWSYIINFNDLHGQIGWAHCNKCNSLYYTGNSTGRCAAGGQHDGNGSFGYSLAANAPSVGQNNWRHCRKCEGLAFSGFGSGVCAADHDRHDFADSWDYSLVVKELSATMQWKFSPFSAGKVDCNGATIIVRQDGNWQFFGSMHDNSTWYGDNYAIGFVIGSTAHGAGAKGSLGALLSGGAVNGTFNVSGKDNWIAQNWQAVASSGAHAHLHVSGDLGPLINAVIEDLKKYGPLAVQFIELIGSAF